MKIQVRRQEDGKWTVLADGELKGKNLECRLGVIDNMPVPLLCNEDEDEILVEDFVEGEEKTRPDLWMTIAGVVMGLDGGVSESLDITSAEIVLEGEIREDDEDEPQIIQFPEPSLIVPG